MEIISLGLGEPDFAVPKELVDATVRVLQTKKSGYSSPLGLPSLREKLANQFKELDGIPCAADNIIITPGAKQSMQLALMALLEPEDEVVVINPSFVSFADVLEKFYDCSQDKQSSPLEKDILRPKDLSYV